MEINYTVRYKDLVVKKHIPQLSPPDREIIRKAINDRLIKNPIIFGKPLKNTLKGYRSFRIGDYRAIYRIDPTEKIVLIVAIQHRSVVYKQNW